MTKEDFDAEVYEYAKSRNGTEDSRMTDRMLAYRAGAEPREKRIEELEDKLSRVKNILLSYIEWEDAVTESKVYVYEDIFVNAINEIEK